MVRRFVEENQDLFGVSNQDLVVMDNASGLGKRSVIFQQIYRDSGFLAEELILSLQKVEGFLILVQMPIRYRYLDCTKAFRRTGPTDC